MTDTEYITADRRMAIALGLPRYTGQPCQHDHAPIRYTRSCACVECVRLQGAAHKAERAQQETERKRLWKAANRATVNKGKQASRKRKRAAAKESARIQAAQARINDPWAHRAHITAFRRVVI